MIKDNLPGRVAAFANSPGFYPPSGLWLYGNVHLLFSNLAFIRDTAIPRDLVPFELDAIGREAEELVLGGKTLVVGVHNLAHRRAAIVPLRWACPRIVVFSGGFRHHLGRELRDEPFKAAQLWRYQWDPKVDLAVSLRSPASKPTFSSHNPTIDRLVEEIAKQRRVGISALFDTYAPILRD